jgi:hypothetical protein
MACGNRELAAILATDIAGYDALLGADEEATARDLSDAAPRIWSASSSSQYQCNESRSGAFSGRPRL